MVSGNSAAVDDQESSVLEAAGGHATMMSVLGNVFGAQATDLVTYAHAVKCDP